MLLREYLALALLVPALARACESEGALRDRWGQQDSRAHRARPANPSRRRRPGCLAPAPLGPPPFYRCMTACPSAAVQLPPSIVACQPAPV